MAPHIDAKCRVQPYLNSQNYVNYGYTASKSMRHDVKDVIENNKWLQHLFAELHQGLRPQVSPTVPPAIHSDGSARGSVHLATFDVVRI